jgi:hypothetical protein
MLTASEAIDIVGVVIISARQQAEAVNRPNAVVNNGSVTGAGYIRPDMPCKPKQGRDTQDGDHATRPATQTLRGG